MVFFLFLWPKSGLNEDLLAVFLPRVRRGEILNILAQFSITSAFTVRYRMPMGGIACNCVLLSSPLSKPAIETGVYMKDKVVVLLP